MEDDLTSFGYLVCLALIVFSATTIAILWWLS